MSADEEPNFGAQEYLCYELLKQLDGQQRDGRRITRTQFLKLTCIADRTLQDEYGRDIELPRYWYQYGEILNETPLTSGVYNTTPAPWGGKQVQQAPGISSEHFDVPTEVRDNIYTVTRRLARRFANVESEKLKQYQYEQYVPSEFIREFDEFRAYLTGTDQHNAKLTSFASDRTATSREADALELLDHLVVSYPKGTYDEMYDLFLRWEDTTRLLLEQERSFGEVHGLLEDFWETFSRVELKLTHEQYTPAEQKARWLRDRDEEKDTFRSTLRELREQALERRGSSGTLESVSEAYAETVNDLL